MSMLAERRRKTKWVINPTKKPIWTTDSEGIKLGKQLMEKMGWSAGKGLGAKEQGIQEPLKVSYKNDTKGMGFKGNDEDWIEHQDEFNSLLSQLSSSDPSKPAEVDKNEIKSLEEKSKHSRARVHYQKFTRGKDLSRYSETDLACILGINPNKKQKDSLEEKINPVEEKMDGNYETSFGVTTINSGSILDYFKKKWTIGKSKENNSSKTDEGGEEILNNTEECTVVTEHKKSKKRKHNELDGENMEVSEDKTMQTLDEEVENPEVGEGVKKDRKSKKRKLNDLNGENVEVPGNEAVDESGEVGNVCSLEVEKESKKHKKSKKKKKESIDIESESVSKVYKKEKYDADNSYRIEENNLDIEVGVENVSGDNNLCIDDKRCDSLQLSGENSKDGDENFTRKRKKDKKKREIKEPDTVDENVEPVEGDFDQKIKKKKKKDKERKEKGKAIECEINEVSGGNYSDRNNEESESISNADDKIQTLEVVEDTDLKNTVDLESGKSRKEKRKKEKHKSDQSKLENGEELKMKCEIAAEKVESKSKKKKKEKLADESRVENEVEVEIKTESLLEQVEPLVKEKKKKGKHKTEQEIETKSKSEETTECKTKEKKKKDKHRSEPSTIENEEEQGTKSKSELEEAEPKVKEKKSKKNKSKHKTDSEGVDKSGINSESVQETNNTNAIQKESERLKKAEIDTKLKSDDKGLWKGRKPKQNGNKTEGSNRIYSHKFELFKEKQKETPFLKRFPDKTPNNRLMGLIFGAEFDKFKGANVENLIGYGMQMKIQDKGNG